MAMRSEVDKRAKRYLARQCLSDTGHKDAVERPKGRSWYFEPVRETLNKVNRNELGQGDR